MQAALLDMVAKEKEKEASKQKKKKEKRNCKALEKEEGEAAAAKQKELQWGQQRQCQQCTALQQCSRCTRRRPAGLQAETSLRMGPVVVSSPTKTPRAAGHHRSELARAEGSGEWEVQHGKRRGAPQVRLNHFDHSCERTQKIYVKGHYVTQTSCTGNCDIERLKVGYDNKV